MASYSVFARYYDEAMGDMSGKIGFLKGLLKNSAPEVKNVLELACGTGTILEGLSLDYSVTGLDLSPEMVEIAKKKLPEADIRVGSMTNYDFGKSFDAVLCVYDSINHLQSWEEWCQTFANAYKHLADGGVFILDFNTIERLKWLADNPPFGREIGDDYMFMKVWDKDGRFDWDIRVFEKHRNGDFTLHIDLIHEISFAFKQILDEIEKSFKVEKVVDKNSLNQQNPNWRPFVICRRK